VSDAPAEPSFRRGRAASHGWELLAYGDPHRGILEPEDDGHTLGVFFAAHELRTPHAPKHDAAGTDLRDVLLHHTGSGRGWARDHEHGDPALARGGDHAHGDPALARGAGCLL
jgi:hypothetical protein